ncbi:MAG: hypothetical protein YK1312THETA_480004 [Marine Group I thaumarchaeote]|nr:MAG: hypothetical protein YK1312THETA_480004 [Marine Group I thaumarchaeote]
MILKYLIFNIKFYKKYPENNEYFMHKLVNCKMILRFSEFLYDSNQLIA